jgi:hypothetical protein
VKHLRGQVDLLQGRLNRLAREGRDACTQPQQP